MVPYIKILNFLQKMSPDLNLLHKQSLDRVADLKKINCLCRGIYFPAVITPSLRLRYRAPDPGFILPKPDPHHCYIAG